VTTTVNTKRWRSRCGLQTVTQQYKGTTNLTLWQTSFKSRMGKSHHQGTVKYK